MRGFEFEHDFNTKFNIIIAIMISIYTFNEINGLNSQ